MIEGRLGVTVEIVEGARGQFDVLLDGVTVAGRSRGLLTRLLGGSWPDEESVVRAIEARMKSNA